MNTSVIIRKLPGHVIPRGYLQEALKNCPTCFGVAIQDKDDNKDAILETSAEKKTLSVDELMKTVEACKDLPMVISLGRFGDNFDETDDLQPFVFQMAAQDEEGPTDILAVFMEGDFPNYSIPDGGHTDEYNLWEKFVFPMMLEKFDLANSDPEDFYTRLRASTTEQAIMNTVGHRAAVVFVPLDGEHIFFGKNELGGEFGWGTTSNRFKWGDPSLLDKAAEVAISAVKKGGRLSRLMTTTAPAEEPKPISTDPKTGIHTVGNTTIVDADIWKRWPGCSAKTHTMTVVPQKLQGNARNRWIRLFTNNPNGDLPKEKDHAGFMVPVANSLTGFAQEDLSTNDEVKTLASKVKHFQTAGTVKPAVSNEQVREAAELAANQHTAAPPKDNRPASDFLPELSADAKKGTVELVTDWATRSKGPSKLDIQRIESKWPKFSITMGIKFEDILGWSIADKKALAKKYPDAMALAFTELQLHIMDNGIGLNKEEPGNVSMPKGPERKQVEVPSPQPGPAPAKKSRLAQLSGKAA
jgi:hypothetical protein